MNFIKIYSVQDYSPCNKPIVYKAKAMSCNLYTLKKNYPNDTIKCIEIPDLKGEAYFNWLSKNVCKQYVVQEGKGLN